MGKCIKDKIRAVLLERLGSTYDDNDLAIAECVLMAEDICEALGINKNEMHSEEAIVVVQMP